MKLIVYFEVNENNQPEDILKGADLIGKAELDFEGSELTNWLITPENWGICIIESDSEEHILNYFNQWRQAVKGCYSVLKCSPALPVPEYAPKLMELVGKINKNK